MKNIIITCWTSLISNLKKNWINFTKEEDDILEKLEKVKESTEKLDIDSKINDYLNKYKIKQLSAEIKTVFVLVEKWFITKKDNINLYYSQTEIWKRLAEIIKNLLLNNWYINIKSKLIEWFIVYNDWFWQQKEEKKANNIFRNIGISNFYTQLEEIKNSQLETIMCPVWWYKALIPYASLYAMVNGWDIKYIYEDSNELMDLPSGALSYYTTETILKNHSNVDITKILDEKLYSKNICLSENLLVLNTLTNFKKSWDLSNFISLIEINSKFVVKSVKEKLSIFKRLDFYLKYCLLNNKELNNILNEIKKVNKVLGDNYYFQRIIKEILAEILNLRNENEIDFKFNMLKWYKDKNRNLEFWLLSREFFIDIISLYSLNKIYKKWDEDDKIDIWEINDKWEKIKKSLRFDILEATINLFFNDEIIKKWKNSNYLYLDDFDNYKNSFELIKELSFHKNEYVILWSDITKIRNNTAHVWTMKFDEKFYKLDDYFEKLQSFKSYILKQKTEN